jgi:hypothetical protein
MKPSDPPPSLAAVVAARIACSQLLPDITARAAAGQLQRCDACLGMAMCLVEVLAARVVPGYDDGGGGGLTSGGGFVAAMAVVKNLLGAVGGDTQAFSHGLELLHTGVCALAVACTRWPSLSDQQGGQGVVSAGGASPAAVRALITQVCEAGTLGCVE